MIATIILLILQAIGLGLSWGTHGQERKVNGWATLIAVIISLILYYYAGLFDNFK